MADTSMSIKEILAASQREAALYEWKGTFADYLCVTAPEMPTLDIGHVDTPSPHTALGAKGMGDGCSMLAPTAIANAVADALGREDVEPPFTLDKVWNLAASGGGAR